MNFSQLKNILKVEHKEYQNIPFWSWNSTIEEEELVKQIVDMKSVGIGGFIMHARSGLSIEYLGEKWFSCIDACLKKAKELDMEAWIYDENGWPSGFVGGKLLENIDFRAQFLDYKVLDNFDENAFVVYKKIGNNYVLIDHNDDSTKEYYTIYLMTSPANTDILNPEVVDAFIRETHEKYYERFSQSFGNELVGFFTDEPQYYSQKTPYSKIVYNDFLQRGWDIKKDLIYLFVDDTDGYSFKMQYYSTINRLYNENYYKKLYLWCENHNVKLTGHTVEESGLAHQMCCCAGAMPTYKYEQIPCVDWLGKEFPNDLIIRQVSSVASQFGKKHILGEIFACCGYDVTLKELKSVADYFMFGGINKLCNHLYPYSISSQAKFDFPPIFSKHSNWFEEFKNLNKYTERLGFIIGETKEDVDVAIIHPIKSAYLDYNREKHMLSVQDLDNDTTELLNLLSKYGIMYHFIDESILESDGKVQGDKIICGECAYSTIIIPKMKNITKSTLDFLTVFEGEILNLNKEIAYIDGIYNPVVINSNITFESLVANTKTKIFIEKGVASVSVRSGAIGDFIFIKNKSNNENCVVNLEGAQNYVALDLDKLRVEPINNHFEIEKTNSIILFKNNFELTQVREGETEDITSAFSVKGTTDNYLVIDKASYSYDGINYSDIMPVQKIFDVLLYDDYKGKIFIKYQCKVKNLTNIKLVCEKLPYLTFTVNGNAIELLKSDFDVMFLEKDITQYMIQGENEIIYSLDFFEHDGVHFALFDPHATESLRNKLYYDTYLDNIYLKGDFCVDETYSIAKKEVPLKNDHIERQGYPFFKGEIIYSGKYDYDGIGNRKITVEGDFIVATITCNGLEEKLVLDNKADITELLKKGCNDIEIRIKTGLRNLFGPLHDNTGSICPQAFTYRTCWVKNQLDGYVENYTIKPVGIKKVFLSK